MFLPRSSLDSPAPSQLPSFPCASLDLPCPPRLPFSTLPRPPAILQPPRFPVRELLPDSPISAASRCPSSQLDPPDYHQPASHSTHPLSVVVPIAPWDSPVFTFFFLRSWTNYNFSLIKRLRASSLALCLLLLAWVCPRAHPPGYPVTERLCQFMDLGRPKHATGTEMPKPDIPALESVVRSHSPQLSKLNTELSSAFSQVTGEMGEIESSSASTACTVASLANQVATLTNMLAKLLPAPPAETSPTLPPVLPAASVPAAPQRELLDPRWEPNITPPPKNYSGEFDKCRGFLGQCQLLFSHQPSQFRSDGAKVALIISSLSDRALDWAIATMGSNPQLASDLSLFLNEFKAAFDHLSGGADAAGRLHRFIQGSRSAAKYTLEFRTLAADSGWGDIALHSAFRRGLSEDALIVRDQPPILQDLITLVLRMDDQLRERRRERAQHPRNPCNPGIRCTGSDVATRSSVSAPPLPQPHSPTYLLILLYCGKAGHLIQGCPIRPKDSARLGRGVLVSRTYTRSPSSDPNKLFPASLA